MDLCAAAMPVGQLLGRLANFINGELWGRPTDVPWAMIFPSAARDFPDLEPIGRHPSQLYEAAIEGLLLFAVLRYMTHQRGSLRYPGLTTGIFLVGMALARSFCELFREPDVVRLLSSISLTPGQAYSLPMGLLGLHDIHRANGIKNFLGICINGIAVFSFSIAHMVSWPRALLMAVAATTGGYIGARTARRVGRKFIRRAVVVIGFVITAVMLWRMW